MRSSIGSLAFFAALLWGAGALAGARLPTGATLDPAASTSPAGNFPLGMAISPDGQRIALLLCGWRQQGVQIADRSGAVLQTLAQPAAFVGIAFSPDGRWLWASGGYEDALYRYRMTEGRAELDRRIELDVVPKKGSHYPAGIALSFDGARVYVAENLSDTIAVVDTTTGAVVQRLQVDRYPYGVVAARNGDVYVSSWGDDSVTRFTPRNTVLRRGSRIPVGRHPSSMLLDESNHRLFITCASIDRVVIVSTTRHAVSGTIDDPPPGTHEGSTPNALARSKDGRLFVAEADNNAVAIFDIASRKLLGRIPTEWYPSAVLLAGDDLIVLSAKGSGTGPNPARPQPGPKLPPDSTAYSLGQINGSVMRIRATMTAAQLRALTARVIAANGWNSASKRAATLAGRFKHVIYIIKENRTYDQVLGDLPGADGDPSLVFFPREVSPNHHALAERFGIFDRFFVNAEVSAQGHNWSTAAYVTDYTEKTTASHYADRGRSYDYQGMNRDLLVDEDDDVAAPSAGYLWNLALKKKITFRDYGEFVNTAEDLGGKESTPFVASRVALRDVVNLDY
ncbi:MAG: SMP-30/gluconolactonase/LRE family protein, partial [Thermoanaerobaculia bacterium]